MRKMANIINKWHDSNDNDGGAHKGKLDKIPKWKDAESDESKSSSLHRKEMQYLLTRIDFSLRRWTAKSLFEWKNLISVTF